LRCCFLPLGASFVELVRVVADRFGVADCGVSRADGTTLPQFIVLDNGSGETVVRDQASWETCLRRCGLLLRPGRLDIRVEAPFVVRGVRLAGASPTARSNCRDPNRRCPTMIHKNATPALRSACGGSPAILGMPVGVSARGPVPATKQPRAVVELGALPTAGRCAAAPAQRNGDRARSARAFGTAAATQNLRVHGRGIDR